MMCTEAAKAAPDVQRRRGGEPMKTLLEKRCVPCEGGIPRLGPKDVALLLPEVPGWTVVDDHRKITKRFTFRDFKETMSFLNRLADLAESEGHHPDFAVRYNVVDVSLNTHVIGGLSENDFILAAKLDQMLGSKTAEGSQ
jgi:4a-hydroxytetrahydrobiopterin dehydratase